MSNIEKREVQEREVILDLINRAKRDNVSNYTKVINSRVSRTENNISTNISITNTGEGIPAGLYDAISAALKGAQLVQYFSGKINVNSPSSNYISWTAGTLIVREDEFTVEAGNSGEDVSNTWVYFNVDRTEYTATIEFSAAPDFDKDHIQWGYYIGNKEIWEFVSPRIREEVISSAGGQEVFYFTGDIELNTPSPNYISWTDGTLYARETSFTVTAGDSGLDVSNKWISFDIASSPGNAIITFSTSELLDEDHIQYGFYEGGTEIGEFAPKRAQTVGEHEVLSEAHTDTQIDTKELGDLLIVQDFSGTNKWGRFALGGANTVLGINADADSHEYKTITAGTGIEITNSTGIITVKATSSGPSETYEALVTDALYINDGHSLYQNYYNSELLEIHKQVALEGFYLTKPMLNPGVWFNTGGAAYSLTDEEWYFPHGFTVSGKFVATGSPGSSFKIIEVPGVFSIILYDIDGANLYGISATAQGPFYSQEIAKTLAWKDPWPDGDPVEYWFYVSFWPRSGTSSSSFFMTINSSSVSRLDWPEEYEYTGEGSPRQLIVGNEQTWAQVSYLKIGGTSSYSTPPAGWEPLDELSSRNTYAFFGPQTDGYSLTSWTPGGVSLIGASPLVFGNPEYFALPTIRCYSDEDYLYYYDDDADQIIFKVDLSSYKATFSSIQLTEGAGANKYLVSDVDGNGTWKQVSFEKQIFTITDPDTKTYSLSYTPVTNSTLVFHNGVALYETEDYTVSGSNITLSVSTELTIGDKLLVQYQQIT